MNTESSGSHNQKVFFIGRSQRGLFSVYFPVFSVIRLFPETTGISGNIVILILVVIVLLVAVELVCSSCGTSSIYQRKSDSITILSGTSNQD